MLQPDGTRKKTDIRTLPFVAFDDNEAHCDGLYGFNLGEGVDRVGPDVRHPFVIRRMKLWEIHYAFRPESPSVLVEDMHIDRSVYGVYHPNYDNHVYRNMTINGDGSEPFNRGLDDDSIQYGPLTVDGLTFTNVRGYPYSIPLIQMSDDNPTGKAVSHFRNVKAIRFDSTDRRPVVDTGGGLHITPETAHGVPVFLHDYFGPDRHAKIEATDAKDFAADGLKYRAEMPLTGHEARVTEVHDVEFPKLLDPVYDLPPTTVITNVRREAGNRVLVRGTTRREWSGEARAGERERSPCGPRQFRGVAIGARCRARRRSKVNGPRRRRRGKYRTARACRGGGVANDRRLQPVPKSRSAAASRRL